ncbi:MAG: SPOR domain-containing protein [Kiloniellaceae bacterium]
MVDEPGRGRGRDDGLGADDPAFSDEGMRRIVFGQDRDEEDVARPYPRDSRSRAFAEDTAELESDLRGRRRLLPAVTALAALFCFGAIVWYAYTWGTGGMTSEELPVVRAEPMAEKVRPEQPGGMEVPHQGIAVLNADDRAGEGTATAERLLPRPEVPAPPPPLEPEAQQAAGGVPEETWPPAPPEAPLLAESGESDVTEAPELAGSPDEADSETEIAEVDGVTLPVRKPGAAGTADDQIAALLEQAPLETANGNAAVPAPPQDSAPAATQTAAVTVGDVVLQLSSVRSEAAAAQEWRRLQTAHPQQLGERRLTLETAQVQGTTYYRVQTGPFASRDAAAAVCAQLKARNQDCLVKQR